MKYSVITPCAHRDLQRIKELEVNLGSQTEQNFEWVVACNDPDLSLRSAHFPVRVVNYPGHSLGAAENAAIRAAQGEYLVFIDADDYLTPNTFRLLTPVVDRYPGDNIFDLHLYYTYEPERTFMISLANDNHPSDVMPDWGKRKRTRPAKRYFNYLNLKPTMVNTNYQLWLKNRYWIYQGDYRYHHLWSQLMVEGKVIPRHLVAVNHIKFDASNQLHPALIFSLHVAEVAQRLIRLSDFHYIMVRHNDPVNDPSICQMERNDRWQQLISAYLKSWLNLSNQYLKDIFGQLTIKRINRYFYKSLVLDLPSIAGNKVRTLVELQKYLQLLPKSAFDSIEAVDRNLLMKIKAGRFSRARKIMPALMFYRDFYKAVVKQKGKGLTKNTYLYFFKHLPVNPHVILFESFLGRNYSDNPKYIYRYLQRNYPGQFKCVWIADAEHLKKLKNDLAKQPNTTVVRRFGFKYVKYLATAKYFVFNMRQPKWFIKRPGMRFIETWHGTPLKRLVFDIENVASANHLYKKIFYHQSRQWDHLVTDNPFSYHVFHHAFMYPQSRMLKSGYPRNDILSSPHRGELARRIKRKLGIPSDKKVILYAPTWRDNQYFSPGHYKFKLHLNIAKLRKHLSSDYVMILRTHYFITNHLDTSSFGNFVYNESDYDDIAELYLVSDILITDYSSVFFDYANLKRPILYYVYDYDSYNSILRGFYLNMKRDLPGPLLKTSNGVLHAIQNIGAVKREYAGRYRKFNQRFNAWDDGHASERVVKAMLNQ